MSEKHNIDSFFVRYNYIGLLLLRLFIGARLLYGVLDNILSWERMTEFSQFLEANQFPFPLASAVLSVYAQFLCSVMILAGYKIRLASSLMIINFIIALVFVHLPSHDSVEAMTPALAMLFGCLTLLFTGAGRISVHAYSKIKNDRSENQ